MSQPSPIELLAQARSGDVKALGRLLELYRDSLRAQAVQQLGVRLNTRVDQSDIVQETFLDAHRDFAGFRGECEAELAGWLKQILTNNVADAVQRHDYVQKRSVRRETPIDESRLAGGEATPSQRAMRAEEIMKLDAVIEEMAPDQREAIRLRYVEGRSLSQMAESLGRSESATASLLKRGVERLRSRLANGQPEQEE